MRVSQEIVPAGPDDTTTVQEKLQRRLAKDVGVEDLAGEIAALLRSFGNKPGRIDVVAKRVAAALAPKLMRRSRALQRLIKYRPHELSALSSDALWDEIRTEILPIFGTQRKRRAKPKTERERRRGITIAKNRYERNRSYVSRPGLIEREFADQSLHSLLLNPVEFSQPTGQCLDEIFHGGTVRMCDDMYSLQSLFGLARKKLAAAGSGIRRGREFFYDYRAVLRCMKALLMKAGEAAVWLPDPARRQVVLTGILFRAGQEAAPEIAELFEKTLLPYLN